jgi:potassium-transporting ATPase KdpC subunit
MLRQLRTAVLSIVVLTIVLGLAYPLAVTGVSQIAFHGKANGSLLRSDGKVVGSKLIGQSFAGPQYFHPRPSAAGNGYDPTASSATNLGPSSQKLLDSVAQATASYRQENGLAANVKVPSDAVTSSASGLDPEISVANAHLQAPRIANARHTSLSEINRAIDKATTGRSAGFLGDPGVNVLELNLALDHSK